MPRPTPGFQTEAASEDKRDDAPDIRVDPLDSPLAAGSLFESLRRDLIDGHFVAGEKLVISVLKDRYRVGLSPLREALNRLAAYGLLEQTHQRGFRVPALMQDDLEEIAKMRLELECMALRRAMERGDTEWESRLLAAVHRLRRAEANQLPLHEWEVLHRAFHRTLISPCGSRWLLRFIDQLHDQFDRYRRQAPTNAKIRSRRDDQHYQLAALSIERDQSAAITLMEDHIRFSFEVALAAVNPAVTPD